MYLQTEKILEERVCHTLLRRGTCRGRPTEVCAPKLVAAGVNGNRQQLVQASKWMIPDPEVEWVTCVKMPTTMDMENQLNEKAKRTQWCTIWRSLARSFATYTNARVFVLRIRVSCAFPTRCTCVEFKLHMKRESTYFETHEYSLAAL